MTNDGDVLARHAALSLALFFAAQAPCSAAAPATLRDVVRAGLAADPDLADQRASLAELDAKAARTNLTLLPQINGRLENDLDRSENLVGPYSLYGLIPQSRYSLNTAEVRATWHLPSVSSAAAAGADARAAAAARATLQHATAVAGADLIAAYFGLVGNQLRVDTAAADLRFRDEVLTLAQGRERAGLIAGVETDRARVERLQSEASLEAAKAHGENARESFASRIGAAATWSPALPSAIPEPPLPSDSLEHMVATGLAHRTDVAAARARVGAALSAIRAQRTTWLPELVVGAAFGNQYSPTFGPLVPGGGAPGFWELSAQERITVPLFDGGAQRKLLGALQARVDAANERLDALVRRVETEVRAAYRAGDLAHRQLAIARQAADLSRESTRIAQRQYAAGVLSLSDAAAAERDAVAANADFVQAQTAYLSAVLQLHLAAGDDDVDDLLALAR